MKSTYYLNVYNEDMNLTESRLNRLIRETVNRCLLREYHNQLRIPFSEFGYGHSFIDEFIDWIQYSSEKGVLPKPSITFENGVKKGYDEYIENGNDEWDSYEALCREMGIWRRLGYLEFDKNGNLYVERSITMPVHKGDINSEDRSLYQNQIDKYEKNVGGCWAVGHDNSDAYCGDSDDVMIVLKGYMFLDDIYWEECVRLWARDCSEYEVRTYPNGRVMLTEIEVGGKTLSVKDFDGPRILRSTFFGNNVHYQGDFAKLGYEKINYDKSFVDRQGNEYTRDEYNKIFRERLKGQRLGYLWNKYGKDMSLRRVNENLLIVDIYSKHYSLINDDGKFLTDLWFDECRSFKEGFAAVTLAGKWNFIDEDGELLWKKPIEEWFDETGGAFVGGFAPVRINDKWNFIDKNCKFLSPGLWFDWCDYFIYGFARVQLNYGWNFIDKNGKLLTELPTAYESIKGKWFDMCKWFDDDGFAQIEFKARFNFIDSNGGLLSPNLWFDSAFPSAKDGQRSVKVDGKWYYLDTNGNLTRKEGQ